MSSALLVSALLFGLGPSQLEVDAHLSMPDAGGLSVGESFRLLIEARHAPGEVALLPATLPLPEALAERTARRKRTRTREGAIEIDRFELELMAFQAGSIEIPPIEVAVGSTTAATPRLEIEVRSNLSADEQLVASTTTAEAANAAMAELERMSAPDPGARTVQVPNWPLIYGLGAMIVLALLALAFQRFRQPSAAAQKVEAPPPPPRPAHEVALERLATLAAAGYAKRGELKAHFVELSEILRVYVGARYDFDSVELTHLELTEALRRVDTPGLDEDELLRLLETADLVKFAKFTPEEEEANAAWSRARQLVLATKPEEEEAAA